MLAAVVVVVLVAGSGSDERPEVAAAPAECVERWNRDDQAVSFGVHNSTAHGYSAVQVTHLTEDATEPSDPDEGLCAVIFARSTLDPEPGAAGQYLSEGGPWKPLSNQAGVDASRLTELQSRALGLSNAQLQTDGTIVAR